MDDLGRYILGFIANGVNDDATTHRTVRTGGTRLRRSRNLEFAQLGVGRREIKPEQRHGHASQRGRLQKTSPGTVHGSDLPFAAIGGVMQSKSARSPRGISDAGFPN